MSESHESEKVGKIRKVELCDRGDDSDFEDDSELDNDSDVDIDEEDDSKDVEIKRLETNDLKEQGITADVLAEYFDWKTRFFVADKKIKYKTRNEETFRHVDIRLTTIGNRIGAESSVSTVKQFFEAAGASHGTMILEQTMAGQERGKAGEWKKHGDWGFHFQCTIKIGLDKDGNPMKKPAKHWVQFATKYLELQTEDMWQVRLRPALSCCLPTLTRRSKMQHKL